MISTIIGLQNNIFSFDGTTFQSEASSIFPHKICPLGNYKDSPFVTGHHPGGIQTEILDYEAGSWIQVDDYPFSNANEYVSLTVTV